MYSSLSSPPSSNNTPLQAALNNVLTKCDACRACVRQCAFLSTNGTPESIARSFAQAPGKIRDLAYECSLCGLCTAVCPGGADPFAMFLELRQDAVRNHELDTRRYSAILGYERRGTSPLFRFRGLPPGCESVLFPGCTLPGTRPGVTWQLFQYLRKDIPDLGVVLDCCTKPSHDLGLQEDFERLFFRLRDSLLEWGVRTVLVACPNCFKVFRQYGAPLEVRTVYEHIREHGLPIPPPPDHEQSVVTVHDPCPLRYETRAQDAVRDLIASFGMEIREMRHRRKRTVCCGEGGSVGFRAPELAGQWGALRHKEAESRRVFTYCGGCANFLQRHVDAVHVLDLVFNPQAVMNGKPKVVTSPFTYLRRLLLKRRFKKVFKE